MLFGILKKAKIRAMLCRYYNLIKILRLSIHSFYMLKLLQAEPNLNLNLKIIILI